MKSILDVRARQALLFCGVLSSILYAVMNVVTPMFYQGYDWTSQTVSELSAIGAPTRTLWVVMGTFYGLLTLGFGLGIWNSAGRSRPLRIAGGAAFLSGLASFFWPPIHTREVIAIGGGTLTDTLHVAWTVLWASLAIITMLCAAIALGRGFRLFTLLSVALLITAGMIASQDAPRMEANLPTPGMGIWQRINIGTFVVWTLAFSILLLRRSSQKSARTVFDSSGIGTEPLVKGSVMPGWESVREAFFENFRSRNELGGACCIYHNGEKVVDLWGGIRNPATGEPWNEDTMVIVFSTTKGLSAMTLALAHSRGLLDYDERVSKYWPEFAQNGKREITVRQLLAHQAGLHAFHAKVGRDTVADLDKLCKVMESEKPEWEPGLRQAYHAITLGFYEGELLRRVDPKHRSLGQFFQDEIATPLELEFYIRVPESVPDSRLAILEPRGMLEILANLPKPLRFASLNPWSHIFRALIVNPGSNIVFDRDRIYARNLEVPSGGGVGTARAIARAYSSFAAPKKDFGLCPETIQELMAPARPSGHGFFDEALKGEMQFSLGFAKPSDSWPFGHEGAFGSPGAGGSLGYADPKVGISYAYITNRMGAIDCDPRDVALRQAIPSDLQVHARAL